MKTTNLHLGKSRPRAIAAAFENNRTSGKSAKRTLSSFLSKSILFTVLAIALSVGTVNALNTTKYVNIGHWQVGLTVELTNNTVLAVYLSNAFLSHGEYLPAIIDDLPTEVSFEGVIYPVKVIGSNFYIPNTCKSIVEQVFIPEGYEVMESGVLFSGCPNLTFVSLPSTLKSIGYNNFSNSPLLTSITFPQGLEEIGQRSFEESGLTSITIPEKVKTIGNRAFYNCPNLTTVNYNAIYCNPKTSTVNTLIFDGSPVATLNIGSSVQVFPNLGATTIRSIQLPSSVEVIATRAFYGHGNLTNITFAQSSSLRVIENSAFEKSGLTSIVLPASCDSLGYGVFLSCTNLTEAIVSSRCLGYSSFEKCTNLKKVILRRIEKTTSFGFSGCTSLTSVEIENSVTSIAGNFYGCTALASIEIPNSVTDISSAFSGCTGLKQIKVNWETPTLVSVNNSTFYQVPTSNTTLIVPRGTKSLYQNTATWKVFRIIEDGEPAVAENGNNTTISWYPEPLATNYQLSIYTDEEQTEPFGTYTLDASGAEQDTRATRSSTEDGKISYTIKGLSSNTNYYYTLTVLTSETNSIATYKGEFTANNSTGIQQVQVSQTLKMYVLDGELRIENLESEINNSIIIFDVTGKVIINKTQLSAANSIHVSHLPSGIYIVKVGNKTGRFIKK